MNNTGPQERYKTIAQKSNNSIELKKLAKTNCKVKKTPPLLNQKIEKAKNSSNIWQQKGVTWRRYLLLKTEIFNKKLFKVSQFE